jgi:Mn2+/Fe2+ NRAMP family transporter
MTTTGTHSEAGISPPVDLWSRLRHVGPGVIIAGSIVGSGELIATTKTGAEAGFVLLWLILLGCVIKVFAQIELGRYAIVSGKTTLAALEEVPGPRVRGRGNWLVWYWCAVWLTLIGQLGGIVGGVGQSLAQAAPLTEQGRAYNRVADAMVRLQVAQAARAESLSANDTEADDLWQEQLAAVDRLKEDYRARFGVIRSAADPSGLLPPLDAKGWAVIVTLVTSVLLVVGRYGLVEWVTMILVGLFTLMTVANLALMQQQPAWRISGDDLLSGLMFRLPEAQIGISPLVTALATFGIIGVGGTELVFYPYWCLEKGYARWTGRNDGSPGWIERARGWLQVMRLDATLALLLYTASTVAFYLLGAAVLNRTGLNPSRGEMVRSLTAMYQPVFDDWATTLLLIGAFAVLYSTFFVANASHARVAVDLMKVLGLLGDSSSGSRRWLIIFSGCLPLLALTIYLLFPDPVALVLLSGVAQGIMLPMLASAALWFRYQRTPAGLEPSRLWDAMLWLSAAGLLLTGVWTAYEQLSNTFAS